MSQFTAEEKEAMKEEAGIAACAFVENGMRIGIGTGSTVKYTILELVVECVKRVWKSLEFQLQMQLKNCL